MLIVAPFTISDPTPQQRAEQLVRGFLAQHGPYMAIYFSDIETAFTRLSDEAYFNKQTDEVRFYQDSTEIFSHGDVNKANAYFDTYKKLNLQRDSMRIHYVPRPMGYLIIHHYQLEGKPWTDSFMVDFNLQHILKINETIE